MKKIVLIVALVLGFNLVCSAQISKVKESKETTTVKDYSKINVQEYAKKDANEVSALLGFDETKTQDFYRLFEMKYQILSDPTISVERKNEMLRVTGLKIQASLDSNQMQQLQKNKELFDRLKN